jgi:hypothetical protein
MSQPQFAGFDDYIEVFAGGRQTDMSGAEHDGDALIDRAVATFDPAAHEPPAVIGHPTTDAPAYAWVEGVKSGTDAKGRKVMLAKFKQVVPEFADMVQRGLFKKRSVKFYQDGRLRHVGFLGAAPPAVKGLADIKFGSDESGPVFEFGEATGTITRIFRRLRDFLIEKEGQEKADRIIPDWDLEYMQEEAKRPAEETGFTEQGANRPAKQEEGSMPDKTFTEQDVEAIRKKAADDAAAAERKKVEAEFAEKAKDERRTTTKATIKKWIADGVAAGKIAPAWKDAGLAAFCERLDSEEALAFSDAGEKQTGLNWFMAFIDSLPKLIEFGEAAGRNKNVGGGDAGAKLEALTRKKLEAKPELGFSAAFSEVQREHPDLAQEYAASLA